MAFGTDESILLIEVSLIQGYIVAFVTESVLFIEVQVLNVAFGTNSEVPLFEWRPLHNMIFLLVSLPSLERD